MSSRLYIETNLLVGIAKGQEDLPAAGTFEIVMPGVCVMEALSRFEGDQKQWNRTKELFSSQAREALRDRRSSHAASLDSCLQQSIVAGDARQNEVRERLERALGWLIDHVRVIPVEPETLRLPGDEYLGRPNR